MPVTKSRAVQKFLTGLTGFFFACPMGALEELQNILRILSILSKVKVEGEKGRMQKGRQKGKREAKRDTSFSVLDPTRNSHSFKVLPAFLGVVGFFEHEQKREHEHHQGRVAPQTKMIETPAGRLRAP